LRVFLHPHEFPRRLVALVNSVLRWVRFFTAPLRTFSPTGLFTAMSSFASMRAGFVPFLQVDIAVLVLLLLFDLAFPRLIRLLGIGPVGLLTGIVVGFLFAHRATFLKITPKEEGRSRHWNESEALALNRRFCGVEFFMRKSDWTPSIVPGSEDQNVYLVVDDLGPLGRVWRESDEANTDLETVILDLLEGQYKNPIRVASFNTFEKWSQDVSVDVARELRRRCDLQLRDIPFFLQGFVDRHEGRYQDTQLPLPMRLV
jgi:hypothetical protein